MIGVLSYIHYLLEFMFNKGVKKGLGLSLRKSTLIF